MASKKTTTETSGTTEATIETTKTTATKAAQPEPTYTAEEFAAAAVSVFGAKPDIVRAALRLAGVTSATKSEAVSIVNNFRKREVK